MEVWDTTCILHKLLTASLVSKPNTWYRLIIKNDILLQNTTKKNDLLLRAWLMECATSFICIDWWGKGWTVVVFLFWALVVLYQMSPCLINLKCVMYGLLFLQLSSSPGCFHPQTFFLKNGLDWFPWTSKWFSLRCLGLWMNHLPPVWWSNFRFMFLKESWCVSWK